MKYFLQTSKSTIAKARSLRKCMTSEEKLVWFYLNNNSYKLRFRRQVPFGPYILDFLCLPKKVVIELDGNQHYRKEAIIYDEARDEYLRSFGLTVLRFRNTIVHEDMNGVLKKIFSECNKY